MADSEFSRSPPRQILTATQFSRRGGAASAPALVDKDMEQQLPFAMAFQIILAIISFGLIIWAIWVSGVTGKVVIVSVIVLIALLTLIFPQIRFWTNFAGLAFGSGCGIYAMIVTIRAKRPVG